MMDYNNSNIESSLTFITNTMLDNSDIYLYEGEYYKVNFNVYENTKLKSILNTFKYKKIGHAHDYPELFPQQDTFTENDIYNHYNKTNVICISEKYKSVMIYTEQKYYVRIFLLIDKKFYNKFNKKLIPILEAGRSSGIFNAIDFKCKEKEYIEISSTINEDDKYVSIEKKKIPKETLVFDTSSEIFNVMEDIKLFFKKDTKELYKKMNILYKRGIILYGDPGNGKSALIRELIRQLHGVTIIIINPNTPRVTFVLSELINALKGKPSIIVIEDIDSVIMNNNRSEFLNILDGINMKSGVYFIGTSNYPERIDPAFVNRSGRFDRSYEIPNPNENVRKAFFRSCKISDILKDYKVHSTNSENTNLSITELFVKYSEGLSMANLKELMVSTQYMLILDKNKSIEECLEKSYVMITKSKTDHDKSHKDYESRYVSYRDKRYPL